MKNVLIIGIILISIFVSSDAQKSFQIEASEGFVFFDYLGDNTVPSFQNIRLWGGYGLHSQIGISLLLEKNKNFKFKTGLSYLNYYYLANDGPMFFIKNGDDFTSFMNLKLGMEAYVSKIPFFLLLNYNNSFLLHKTKQSNSQNRWFSTIDFGFGIQLGSKVNLTFSSPVTLTPLTDPKTTHRPSAIRDLDYDPWIEVSGINIGINYRFTYSD